MLLTISTTARPATDLGFLLHKHPDRVQEFGQSYGVARVLYPEASEERCTAALMLDVDPVRLVRSRDRSTPDYTLGQYVNDRPYAASSLLAVALADVFRTARTGRCASRPELAAGPMPLEITLPVLPCKGGPELAHRLFEPLGWRVEATALPLDEEFPEWGDSRYVRLALRGEVRLADALNQLYVLLPVLDDAKHYWVAPDEVDKLIRAGESWLAAHPDRGLITRRYLGRRWALTRTAFARLAEIGDDVEEDLEPPVEEDPSADPAVEGSTGEGPTGGSLVEESAGSAGDSAEERPVVEGVVERNAVTEGFVAGSSAVPGTGPSERVLATPAPPDEVLPAGAAPPEGEAPRAGSEGAARRPLNALRLEAVLATLERLGVSTVIDLGCGSGRLVGALLDRSRFTGVAGVDVSSQALALAARRLKLDRMPERRRERLELFQGALTYTDARFAGYDAAVLMEVVEHVDPPRLDALERVVFGTARPGHVIVTTPNAEHNVRYEFLSGMRHPDHRFEWTRAEFRAWAAKVCAEYGYRVEFLPVGDDDPEVGAPTQMALFGLKDARDFPGASDGPVSTADRPGNTEDRPGNTADSPSSTEDRPGNTADGPGSTADGPGSTGVPAGAGGAGDAGGGDD
ncbi:3' terminal RNA ribose 2'-O-methyltransferase Hen1 [Streptosporangium sp. V21-05]|uniref:3' terminal RNA ribose 2'-O-methyltransferase Hen1 n=1 Tax=Streptosporangium sp. V21-05 TaxID=3446115 RepID=UPI003F53B19C